MRAMCGLAGRMVLAHAMPGPAAIWDATFFIGPSLYRSFLSFSPNLLFLGADHGMTGKQTSRSTPRLSGNLLPFDLDHALPGVRRPLQTLRTTPLPLRHPPPQPRQVTNVNPANSLAARRRPDERTPIGCYIQARAIAVAHPEASTRRADDVAGALVEGPGDDELRPSACVQSENGVSGAGHVGEFPWIQREIVARDTRGD